MPIAHGNVTSVANIAAKSMNIMFTVFSNFGLLQNKCDGITDGLPVYIKRKMVNVCANTKLFQICPYAIDDIMLKTQLPLHSYFNNAMSKGAMS